MNYGTAKKIDIRLGYSKLDLNAWWGYRIDRSASDPRVTRIGKDSLISSMPVLSQVKAAVIKDDESVNYYLDPTDFDKKADGSVSDLTGADGQVMIYKPAYYKRVEIDGDIVDVKFSLLPLPGYTHKQAYWIGQQLGYIDAGGKLCSIHGVMPTTNKNRAEFRAAAQLRGSSNWCVYPYEVWEFVNDFARFKYADRNSQIAAMLGEGATNSSSGDWNTYNGYNPIVSCGLKKSVDDVEVAFSVDDWPTAGAGTFNSQAACFYGIEHIFGHIWQYVDGLNIHNSSANGARAFICTDPANFADDTETNYTLAGNLAEVDGYIKQMINGGVLPSAVGGGSSTYFCDYHYSYFDNNADVGWRGSRVGGSLLYGSLAGLACSTFRAAASARYASLGSRLCLRVAR